MTQKQHNPKPASPLREILLAALIGSSIAVVVLVLCAALCGCRPIDQRGPLQPLASPVNLAAYEMAPPVAIAMQGARHTPPAPDPTPQPQPGEKCQRCGGTGRIKPDGRIEIACPDCAGTGQITLSSVLSRMLESQRQLRDDLRARAAQPAPIALPPAAQPAPRVTVRWETSIDAARDQSLKQNKPCLVIFSGEYCAPCKKLETEVIDAATLQLITQRCVAAKIDAAACAPETLSAWSVPSIPKVFLIRADWTSRVEIGATHDAQQFRASLVYWLDRFAKENSAGRTSATGSRTSALGAAAKTARTKWTYTEGAPLPFEPGVGCQISGAEYLTPDTRHLKPGYEWTWYPSHPTYYGGVSCPTCR
jgi:hypothetical protein